MELNIENIPNQKKRITVANNGIGSESTINLVKVGNKVIMTCTNMDKANIVKDKISLNTYLKVKKVYICNMNNNNQNTNWWLIDKTI